MEHIVGRLPSCDLQLNRETISGAHALIRWHSEAWQIRDLGSHNGTIVASRRLAPGETVRVSQLTTLTFGDDRERWQLVCDESPQVRAAPVDGGPACVMSDTVIAVPGPGDPQGVIFHTGRAWCLEQHGESRPLEHNQTFRVQGRKWRFECPGPGVGTPAIRDAPTMLRGVRLCFRLSRDEERVGLVLEQDHRRRELPPKSCFYLGAVLARKRLEDIGQAQSDPGWVEVSEVLRMIPDYTNQSHLNVDIHRLRRELGAAGIIDAGSIIERQRGRLRLGAHSLRIEPWSS